VTTWLISTRAVHFGACLLFFGVFVFDRFIASALPFEQSGIAGYWQKQIHLLNLILLPLVVLSGIAWFVLVAMTMSGQPLQMEILKIVWAQTQFGTVWKIRLIILTLALIITGFSYFLKFQAWKSTWVQVVANGCLLGSLAWAGHGQESSSWHLFADVLHLLAAGFWPGGLLPLFLLLRKSRQSAQPADWYSVSVLVRRFSAISLAAVSLLVLTGLVNSWFLVGSISNLVEQPYGRWLLVKIGLFCAALAIASVNLIHLKPRLLIESSQPERAATTVAQLQTNVQIELFLGMAIIIVVAVLGILPPAIH
jgi:copper resistance protein D